MTIVKKIIAALLFTGVAVSNLANASDAKFTSSQENQIQTIVHDYIVEHPQVLVEAGQKLQQQQMQARQQQASQAIVKQAAQLFSAKASPVAGNSNGSVTLIEFLDYQCPHCKDMRSVVAQVITKNPNIKVIFKQLPIFGANSDMAARMALVVAQQEPTKYFAFHNALLDSRQPLTSESIVQIAKNNGINVEKIKTVLNDASISTELTNNQKLADEIGLLGTPSFIIAPTPDKGNSLKPEKVVFIPGGASVAEINQAIKQVEK